jgi:hypothetical protein
MTLPSPSQTPKCMRRTHPNFASQDKSRHSSPSDVAQTEGADLPEFEHSITGEVGEHRDRLIAFLDSQNIALEYNENIAPALGVSYGGKIAILPGQSPAEEV